MIYVAEYTRDDDAGGCFDHHFEAPVYRVVAGRPRLTDGTMRHVAYYGKANGATAVTVRVATLARVGYRGHNAYGVNSHASTCEVLTMAIDPLREWNAVHARG